MNTRVMTTTRRTRGDPRVPLDMASRIGLLATTMLMASIMLFGGGNGVQWAMGAKLAQGSAPREQQVSNVNVTSLMLKNDGEHRVARKDSVKVDRVGDGSKVHLQGLPQEQERRQGPSMSAEEACDEWTLRARENVTMCTVTTRAHPHQASKDGDGGGEDVLNSVRPWEGDASIKPYQQEKCCEISDVCNDSELTRQCNAEVDRKDRRNRARKVGSGSGFKMCDIPGCVHDVTGRPMTTPCGVPDSMVTTLERCASSKHEVDMTHMQCQHARRARTQYARGVHDAQFGDWHQNMMPASCACRGSKIELENEFFRFNEDCRTVFMEHSNYKGGPGGPAGRPRDQPKISENEAEIKAESWCMLLLQY